ncbi:MAG: hypothetical protein HY583_03160 [Candidatus Omnitrophica bacterium]|nr:hypothetical protein [Candidatus Omnitrophota bacterium]
MSYRNVGLLILSLLLLILSIWIPQLEFLIWIGFVPFFLAIQTWSPFKSLFAGLFLGALFLSALLYWIVYYELRIFLIVILLTLPFFSLFGFSVSWFWRRFKNHWIHIFAPPISWSFASFLYSLTPINTIGDQISFLQAPLFPGIVRIAGISGVTFFIMLTNSLTAQWIATRDKRFRNELLIAVIMLGLSSILLPQVSQSVPIKVAIVQHNFPISPDWRSNHRRDIITTYEKTIRELGGTADLIVFPQYGLPIDVLREPKWLEGLARLKNTSILLGTYIPKLPGGSLEGGERFDTALLFTPNQSVQEYRAMTPPPFRRIGQVLGTEKKPLLLDDIKIGPMLCYEDVKSEEGKNWVKSEAEILFPLSNPGHFLRTLLPKYHLFHDRIRAIETNRYVVRVSPNGFSAIIDPNGKIIAQSELNREEILKGTVYPSAQRTPFVKVGLVIHPFLTVIGLILLFGNYVRDSIKRFARRMR